MGKSVKTKMTQLIMKRALCSEFSQIFPFNFLTDPLISHVGNPLVMIVF